MHAGTATMQGAIDEQVRECAMLGAAMMGAQRVEFLLYGVVSHLAEIHPEESRQHRSRDPEQFLRGDPSELKATMGRLVRDFGDRLLLTSADLSNFVRDRNLIIHNYWRLTKANVEGAQRLQDPERFLIEFAEKCSHWERVLRGLVAGMKRETARKLGRHADISDEERAYIEHYERHAEVFLAGRTA